MVTIEKYIYRFVISHFILLLLGQWLLTYQDLTPYLNKIVFYEGVIKDKHTEIIETMNR